MSLFNRDGSDQIDEIISKNISDDIFTPETLAWRLLVDDEIKNDKNIKQLLTSIDLNEELNPDIFNKEAYLFEILLTVYLEMLFGWYKLLYLMENEEKGNPEHFKLNLAELKLKDLVEPFTEKFKLIGYNLNIYEINNKDYYERLKNESYCRVALRDLPSDFGFFEINKNRLDKEKRYHFILNSKFKGKTVLRDIFMLLIINDIGYKICFSSCTVNCQI
jgi:hypothetical protein